MSEVGSFTFTALPRQWNKKEKIISYKYDTALRRGRGWQKASQGPDKTGYLGPPIQGLEGQWL